MDDSTLSRQDLLAHCRTSSSELKALLKTQDVTAKNVEAARLKLRQRYVRFIQLTPASSRLLDVANLLWQDTSHAFIHRYRQKIAQMDKTIEENKRSKRPKESHDKVGVTARKKLVAAFRNFLLAEEQFWSELLVSTTLSCDVKEVLPCLGALGIQAGSQRSQHPAPSDDADPLTTKQRMQAHERAVLFCHRCLIFYGDLARYRELYSDKGRKSKESQAQAEGDHVLPKWARAAEAYHQARLLVPDHGNPSNQLAVLSSYSQDTLSSVYHYYRAICVKQVFKEARDNLSLTFRKIIKSYKGDDSADAKLSIYQAFVDEFTVMHAHIFFHHDVSLVEGHLEKVAGYFSTCLSRRLITSEAIVKVLCTCLAAWFDVRMFGTSRSGTGDRTPAVTHKDMEKLEACALQVTVDLLGVIFAACSQSITDMAKEEDTEGMPTNSRIAPVLRRALPTLRIASKWILGHSNTLGDAATFWEKYVNIVEVLSASFPVSTLPELPAETILEENIDMAGFLPVSQMLRTNARSSAVTGVSVVNASHPNEEHLMRVADVLSDANLLASNANLPIGLQNGHFVVRKVSVTNLAPTTFFPTTSPYDAYEAYQAGEFDEDEDEHFDFGGVGELSTDADIVDLAVRAGTMATGSGEDEEMEDEVLFPGSPHSSPKVPPKSSPSMAGRLLSGERERSSPGQTASDLLLQVLNGPANVPVSHPTSQVTAPPNVTGMLNPSIWAPNAAELPPPSSFANAAYAHPFGAAPLSRDRQQGQQIQQSPFPYG